MTKRKTNNELIHVRRKLRSVAENADALANVIQAADENLILVRMQELEDDLLMIRRFLTKATARPKPKVTPEQTKQTKNDRKP